MIYELEIRRPMRLRPIWKARLDTPFMAFNTGQFIDQPGGRPFKIEEVRHTFDKDEGGAAVHRIALIVSE